MNNLKERVTLQRLVINIYDEYFDEKFLIKKY